MPSSSARCAQFPRAQDKVHFYIKLKELRDHLKGIRQSTEIEEVAYSFDLQLAKGKLSNLYKTAEWNLFSKSQGRRLHCDIMKITTFPASCAVKFWIKCLTSGSLKFKLWMFFFYINRGCQEGGHKGGAVRSWL